MSKRQKRGMRARVDDMMERNGWCDTHAAYGGMLDALVDVATNQRYSTDVRLLTVKVEKLHKGLLALIQDLDLFLEGHLPENELLQYTQECFDELATL